MQSTLLAGGGAALSAHCVLRHVGIPSQYILIGIHSFMMASLLAVLPLEGRKLQPDALRNTRATHIPI